MKRLAVLIISLLLFSSLACLGSRNMPADSDQTPEPQKTEETLELTESPVTDRETIEPDEIPEIDEAADFSQLNSYRSWLTLSTVVGEDLFTSTVELEATRNPRAQHTVIFNEGDNIPASRVRAETIIVNGEQWTNSGAGWVQTRNFDVNTIDPFETIFTFSTSHLNRAIQDNHIELVGEEELNGISTLHYHGEGVALSEYINNIFQLNSISNAEIDFWLPTEDDLPVFPIKIATLLEGTLKQGNREVEGRVSSTQEIYDLNAEIVIESPAETSTEEPTAAPAETSAEKPTGTPTEASTTVPVPANDARSERFRDIPVYHNVQEVYNEEGLSAFRTPDSLEQVMAFYKTEMANQGWILQNENNEGEIYQYWKKENYIAFISFGFHPKENVTGVAITVSILPSMP